MKLKKLQIENIRSYKKLDLAFEDGVTVISGVNGSGKSSLLEACFMGLFGSKILSKDFVLADMIFKGAEKAAIGLDFEHLGRDFRLEQGFRYSQKSKNASNSKCVLYADGESIVDQAGRTYEEVCALLNMDEEAYRNCAYIRQGEIDVLINAKPKDRQRMIDELLQLGKLEEYRERANRAKTGIGRLERDAKNSLSDVRAEIEEIERTEPVQALNAARQKAKESDEELKRLNGIKESAVSEKEKVDRQLAEYKEYTAEIRKLKNEIEEAGQQKGKCFGEKNKLDGEIRQREGSRRELKEENAAIREEAGFGDLEIEPLVSRQEKAETLAREKLSGISGELALVLKDREALEKAAEDREKDIKEAEKAADKCKKDIEAEKTGIETCLGKIRKLEEESFGIRIKAGIIGKEKIETGNEAEDEAGTKTESETGIRALVKEREEKESLLRDRKTEIANKLSLAGKERESTDESLTGLEKDMKTCLESGRESEGKLETLESELKKNALEILELQEEKEKNLESLEELGFDEEKLDKLEDIGDLLQYNKDQLLGNSKELETRIKELEKVIKKNRKLLAEGKCPTCGQELEGSEVSGTVEESEKERDELALKFTELAAQQAGVEKKLDKLKAARRLEKKIAECEKELEKLQNNTLNLEKLLETHKTRVEEEGRKLEGFDARKTELENRKEKLLLEIDALKEKEREAVKAHGESEAALREAKEFEKKLSENAAEIEKLKGKIQAAEALIENYEKRAGELEAQKKTLEARKAEGKADLEKLGLEIEALKEKEKAAKEAHAETENLLDRAKKLRENLLGITKIEHEISGYEAEIRNLTDKIGFLDKEILKSSEQAQKLEEKMKGEDFEGLKLKQAQFENACKNIEATIREITGKKDGILKEIGRIETTLKRLSTLREDKKALENKKAYLEAVGKNAEELENTYMRIRADMRIKNIGALSKLLNEMFSFMYANNAYSHIELDPEYNLTVFRKDGTPLEPKLLSGGERAIFNLILRCAIYRLLALGFGGDKGDNLPPMILDEPTVFLDRGHIRQLLKLIDLMRNMGVGQIIVVSHDESLIDSADHVFQVEKDPLTNMSSISRKVNAGV